MKEFGFSKGQTSAVLSGDRAWDRVVFWLSVFSSSVVDMNNRLAILCTDCATYAGMSGEGELSPHLLPPHQLRETSSVPLFQEQL